MFPRTIGTEQQLSDGFILVQHFLYFIFSIYVTSLFRKRKYLQLKRKKMATAPKLTRYCPLAVQDCVTSGEDWKHFYGHFYRYCDDETVGQSSVGLTILKTPPLRSLLSPFSK